METLATADDFRHTLTPGEHEAFYFVFSSPDQQIFGCLRTLFSPTDVLELVALRFGEQTWVYQQRTALPGRYALSGDASGPALILTCWEPWQTWRCRLRAAVRSPETASERQAALDLTFTALNDPARYRFGPYQQAQQDGQMEGRIQVGSEVWSGDLLGYRDHSWGQRSAGLSADWWTVACVPGRFYIVAIRIESRMVHWGRFVTPDGGFEPLRTPQATVAETAWQFADPAGGLGFWQAKRQVAPLVIYLGQAGQEAVRSAPQPADLYRDEIGPARFTFPQGETVVGFIEQARRLS